jgi:antirestriction protein ArdC
MLESVQQYNALNGVITRNEIEDLKTALEHDEQQQLADKLNYLLTQHNTVSKFDVSIENKGIEAFQASMLGCLDYNADPEEEHTGLNKAVSQNDIYQMVTDKIINAIETSGNLTWYSGRDENKGKDDNFIQISLPMNFNTKKNYRGINAFMLSHYPVQVGTKKVGNKTITMIELQPIVDDRLFWLTFKQIKDAGGKLKSGAKSNQAVYYNFSYSYDGKNISEAKYKELFNKFKCVLGKVAPKGSPCSKLNKSAFLKYYNVFNERDIEGIDFILERKKIKDSQVIIETEDEKIACADLIIKNMPNPPKIISKHIGKGESPYYTSSADKVVMPLKKQYDDVSIWYGTAFHELIHSTGHKKRLNRDSLHDYHTDISIRAFEELIAELGSAFLNAESGILLNTLKKNTAYIKGWKNQVLKTLRNDNKAIFKASARAQKASDYILDKDSNGVPKYLKDFKKKPVEKTLLEQQLPVKKLTDNQINSIVKEYASDILFTDKVDKYVAKVRAEFNLRKLTKIPIKQQVKKASKTQKKESTKPKVDENGQFGLFGVSENTDTIAFNKQIIKAMKKGFTSRQTFILGFPKGVLIQFIPNFEIKHTGALLKKSIKEKHQLNWGHFMDLPDKLNNPSYIFKSTSRNDNELVIVVNLKDIDGNKVVVPVRINTKTKEINITSVYGKQNPKFIENWEKKGLLLYNKKSALNRTVVAPIATGLNKTQNKDTQKGLNYVVVPEKTIPQQPIPKQIARENTNTVVSTPMVNKVKTNQEKTVPQTTKNPLIKNLSTTKHTSKNIESYAIGGDISEFLGDLEIKPKDSLAITLDAEQGAGKTRFLFQLLNEFSGSGYKCLFVSLEEHPESSLFNDKVKEYINPANEYLIDTVGELPNWYADLKELIPHYDCIFIDSWSKIAEEDRTVDFDKHLRKGFDSKLFVTIFQRTSNGTMRGGSKSQFDGDIILRMEKDPDYRNSFVYANKNRYQNKPLDSLKYNIFNKSLVRENNPTVSTEETSGYVVVD